MRGRTALVTGASRGLGAAIAARFRELGADVLAPARRDVDLSVDTSVDDYLATLDRPVDILVNNAGINPLACLEELSDADLGETLRVNLISPLRLCRGLAPGMAARAYGRIVNISSVWSVVAKPRRVPYTVSKAGLNGMTRSLAVELAPRNVLVNAVAPGFVNTELTLRNNTAADLETLAAQTPVGRLAEPAEIAELVAFLCSERNSFMTGQVLVCDGGFSCL